MKKICILVCMCFFVVISTVFASGELRFVDIKIFFDGEEVILKDSNNCDTNPIVYNNTIYVPIRNVVEKFNGCVTWDAESKKIMVYKDYFKKIGFQIGGYQVSVDYINEEGEVIKDETIHVEPGFDDFTDFRYDIFEYTYIIDGAQPMPAVFIEAIDGLNVIITQATEEAPFAIITVYYGEGNNEYNEYKINFVRDHNSFLEKLLEEDGCYLLNYKTNFLFY